MVQQELGEERSVRGSSDDIIASPRQPGTAIFVYLAPFFKNYGRDWSFFGLNMPFAGYRGRQKELLC